jgi:hypothetical protein
VHGRAVARVLRRAFDGVVLMTLVTLPLAVLVVWALARRRLAVGVTSAWQMSLAEVGMVHGTVLFVRMTLMPGCGTGIVPARVSLVPLRDLSAMGLLGIVGNLLVFAALGFFAPMQFATADGCAANPGARGRLLGPDRNRAIRPAAGPGVLRRRRTAQRRRRRAGRLGVAPLVAHRRNRCQASLTPQDEVGSLIGFGRYTAFCCSCPGRRSTTHGRRCVTTTLHRARRSPAQRVPSRRHQGSQIRRP